MKSAAAAEPTHSSRSVELLQQANTRTRTHMRAPQVKSGPASANEVVKPAGVPSTARHTHIDTHTHNTLEWNSSVLVTTVARLAQGLGPFHAAQQSN